MVTNIITITKLKGLTDGSYCAEVDSVKLTRVLEECTRLSEVLHATKERLQQVL